MRKEPTGSLANRSILLPLLALLAVAALALGIAPRYPTARSNDQSVNFSQPRDNAPFRDLINSFQPQSITFGPNIRANQDATTFGQHEPSLAVSRVNTNTVIVASKDYRDGNVKHVWIDGSTDGGVTWPVQLQMPGIPAPLNIQSDPVVVARDDGRIYVAVLATNDAQSSGGIFITWTDNNGTTWQNPSVPVWYPKNGLDDKEWFAIDNNPASPYYHRMYMMYVPFAGSFSGRVVEQHSTDGGLTWTARQAIGISNTEYNYPVVASDGTVYDFMMQNWGPSQTGTIRVAKSTNGGVTWTSPSVVASADQPASPIRSGDLFRFFAILSAAVDPNNGHLYVAWTDNRNFNTNGTDVVYVKSTDNGATWSPQPIRLSHDPTGVVRDHHTPVLTIGADSRIHAFWMDRRLDPTNRFFHSWYSSSTDGGATWEPDIQVTSVAQDLNLYFPPGSGNAAGDYWGLDTYLDTIYVAWNDTRGGDQDILVSKGLITSGAGGTPTPTTPPTNTPLPTNTVPPTVTPIPTNTTPPSSTPIPSNTTIPSNTPTNAPTQTPGGPTATTPPSSTPIPTSTSTTTTPPSNTPTNAPTQTPGGPTATTAPTDTPSLPSPTPTACPLEFEDVPIGSTFHLFIRELACRAIVSGYPCGGPGEPCGPNNLPYFRPAANVTRGQLSKIVVLSAGLPPAPNLQHFEDVPIDSTFHPYVEALYSYGAINGYPCGGPGEPCIPTTDLPYFRPNATSTRGQISKIVAIAANFTDPAEGQTFEDVPVASTFYLWIENLASRAIITGYPCGSPSEPCGPDNRPYFRPNDNVTRGQMSKIAVNSFFP